MGLHWQFGVVQNAGSPLEASLITDGSAALVDVIEHPYFDSIERSWANSTKDEIEPRLSRCVEKCAITTKALTKDKREKL